MSRRQHAIEEVDTERHGIDQPGRIADAHEIADAVVGQRADGCRQRGPISARVSPTDRPPMPYPSKPISTVRIRALDSQRFVNAALCDAEQRLALTSRRDLGPRRPRRGAFDGHAHDVRGDGSGGHTSSTIWMSAPMSDCTSTASSGVSRWLLPSYVERNVAPSSSTFTRALGQREDLEAAGVGEHRAVPTREPVQSADRRDGISPGAQHEVIRVREHDLGARDFEVGGVERPHRTTGTDGHEGGCRERGARHRHGAPPRARCHRSPRS